jgi:hypothetical protein
MAYENIRADEPAFCCAGDYFYTMKPAPTNMLIQKTSYGDPVMTYPFSHEIDLTSAGTSFLSLQYDGINFWSLEKRNVSSNLEKERILRRWRIENFVCTLKDSWNIRAQGSAVENINGEAFAVENYFNTITEACGDGTGNLDRIKLKYPHAAFFHNTDRFYIKSASGNYGEDMPVATAGDPDAFTVKVAQSFQNVYSPGDHVILRRDVYFFNNAGPSQGDSGAAVYRFTIYDTDGTSPTTLQQPYYKGCHESGIYEQTKSASFVTTSGIVGLNDGEYTGYIVYVRGQQLLLKKPGMPSGGITYPGNYTGTDIEFRSNDASMIIDNAIKNDRVNIWPLYDLATSVDTALCTTVNLYRLQLGYTYGAIEGTWSTYNYVVSVMRPMLTSIALTAEPALVVANGVDTAMIWATVRDQYGAPMNGKRIVFGISATDDATKGYFVCPDTISECIPGSFTWLDGTPHRQAEILTGSQSAYPGGPVNIDDETAPMAGKAVIQWRAGTKSGLVTIVAVVQP